MTTDIERGGIEVGGSHEPSYYEIALTNRQVVVAFVILLTCVVAAFFSGVWIGRESAARAQERLALLGRGRAADGANADADKAKQEGQALQEFKFFADSRQRPAAARDDRATKGAAGSERPAAAKVDLAAKGAAGSRSEPSTLADDLHRAGGSEDHAAASVAPRAASRAAAASAASAAATRNRRDSEGSSTTQASQAPAAAEAAGEGEPLPVTPQPAARAARGPRTNASPGPDAASAGKPSISWSAAGGSPAGASPAAAGAQPAGAAAAAAAGEVVIQVFSTADKEQADKVRDGLVQAGFTAFLSPIAKGGQTMYRVRIGPFPSRTAAEPVAEKVRKERKLDTWITPK
jgi:cell division septation protein DedD